MSFIVCYLDLGSGSMFLQIILAGLMGAGFIIKQYWRRITRFFGRKPTDNETDKSETVAPE